MDRTLRSVNITSFMDHISKEECDVWLAGFEGERSSIKFATVFELFFRTETKQKCHGHEFSS